MTEIFRVGSKDPLRPFAYVGLRKATTMTGYNPSWTAVFTWPLTKQEATKFAAEMIQSLKNEEATR